MKRLAALGLGQSSQRWRCFPGRR